MKEKSKLYISFDRKGRQIFADLFFYFASILPYPHRGFNINRHVYNTIISAVVRMSCAPKHWARTPRRGAFETKQTPQKLPKFMLPF
ncbi:MAG: hypothetical protein CW341_10655 [Bacteroidetes bacterium]|nr:hypothetical protein [Bacteroidota bacterium]